MDQIARDLRDPARQPQDRPRWASAERAVLGLPARPSSPGPAAGPNAGDEASLWIARSLLRLWDRVTDGGFALPEQCAARLQELVEWVEGAEGPIWTSEGVDESLIRRLRGLSPQERRIVDQVRRGYTSRQIGLHLGLAEKTVRNYVSTVIGKLGLKSRRDIVALLADQGEASA